MASEGDLSQSVFKLLSRALGRWLLAPSLLFFCSAFTFPNELRSSLGEPALAPLKDHSQSLKIGERVQQELSDVQINSYSVELALRQFLRVDLYSSNVHLEILVIWPGEKKSSKWTVSPGRPTPISLIAGLEGTYRLEVIPLQKKMQGGYFRLQVVSLHTATKHDMKQVIACQALSDAVQMRLRQTLASSRKAINNYQEAVSIWRVVGDRSQEACALENVGDLYDYFSEHEKALSAFAKAIVLHKGSKDHNGENRTFTAMAAVYRHMGENQRAIDLCTNALEGSQADGDQWAEAEAFHCLGTAHYFMNEMPNALEFLTHALILRQSLHDITGEASTLLILGYIHHALKEINRAKELYKQSLRLWQEAGDLQGQAITLMALGHLFNIQGERQQALGLYDQSMKLFQTIGELTGQSTAIQGLGSVFLAMGEKEKSTYYYLQLLAMSKQLRRPVGEAVALEALGVIYRESGDFEKSLRYSQQAVLVNQKLFSPLGESNALGNLGRVYESMGDKKNALESYNRALELCRSVGDPFQEGSMLNALGHIYHEFGDTSKALEFYLQALNLQQAAKDSVGLPGTFYNLARAERDLDNLEQAIRYAEQALEITESLRGKVASLDLRSSFVASVHQQYELTIDLLMQMHQQHPSEGYGARAFGISERARARSLLESLAETGTETQSTANPALVDRRGQLQNLLNAKADQQMRLSDNKSNPAKDAALSLEIGNLTTQYEQVKGQIRSESPQYAALAQVQPLTMQEIQDQILDEQSLLLEFALGDDQSYLWAVTQKGMTCHLLPKRGEIDQTARRLYGLLIARQPKPDESPKQYQARVKEADAQYWQQAAALSQVLLGPVAGQLGKHRLLIVAEGALQYIPFGALPRPTVKSNGDTPHRLTTAAPLKGGISEQEQEAQNNNSPSPSPQPSPPVGGEGKHSVLTDDVKVPLIFEHEIINLPSASALSVLRQGIAKRETKATKSVAILADPVFEAYDPRVSGRRVPTQSPKPTIVSHHKSTAAPLSDLQLSLRDVGMLQGSLSIPRLPSTRQEAEAILSVSPAGSCLKAVDFRASRVTAVSPELSQFQIVHFATHGLLNNEHPELSGLVLSLVDEQGKPQNGFLRLHDIYNLKLPADLVVLSACNTGLGKDIKGEGLVGIVRGFMYAGAARIVASLWKVDDEATAELMKRFYQQMLQENLSPAAALRVAQVELSQQKKWHSPYYWAGFVLQGEWK